MNSLKMIEVARDSGEIIILKSLANAEICLSEEKKYDKDQRQGLVDTDSGYYSS